MSQLGGHDILDTGFKIHLNAQEHFTRAATLADLVAEQGHADAKIATALNGEFVPAAARASKQLQPGDRIEIVAPRQGG